MFGIKSHQNVPLVNWIIHPTAPPPSSTSISSTCHIRYDYIIQSSPSLHFLTTAYSGLYTQVMQCVVHGHTGARPHSHTCNDALDGQQLYRLWLTRRLSGSRAMHCQTANALAGHESALSTPFAFCMLWCLPRFTASSSNYPHTRVPMVPAPHPCPHS